MRMLFYEWGVSLSQVCLDLSTIKSIQKRSRKARSSKVRMLIYSAILFYYCIHSRSAETEEQTAKRTFFAKDTHKNPGRFCNSLSHESMSLCLFLWEAAAGNQQLEFWDSIRNTCWCSSQFRIFWTKTNKMSKKRMQVTWGIMASCLRLHC